MAEVCDKIRPDWSAANGPQSVWAETAYILAAPPALALAILLLLALLFPRLWLALPVTALTLAFAALLFVARQAPMAIAAQAEGCLATATPAIALLTPVRALHARRRRA